MAAHEYLIALDSDGCVFDTMGLKHRECFIPALIRVFGLQSVAADARRIWEEQNLYSPHRGMNRFLGLIHCFKALVAHGAGDNSGAVPTALDGSPLRESLTRIADTVEAWLNSTERPGSESLAVSVDTDQSGYLARVLEWTKSVDVCASGLLQGLEPFSGVRDAIRTANVVARVVVISQSTTQVLEAQWRQAGLRTLVQAVYGQESGAKKTVLQRETDGRDPARILFVGDAPGDKASAESVGTRFFGIIPSREQESWTYLNKRVLPHLLSGQNPDRAIQAWNADFDAALGLSPYKGD